MQEQTSSSDPARTEGWLARALMVRQGERVTLTLSALYFFTVLFSYYLVRPVREAMGVQRGFEDVPALMTATLVVMVVVNPVYSAIISRYPRRVFIPWVYRFFAVNLLLFAGAFAFPKESLQPWLGYGFYVWLSVFNLFVVSIFWGFMSDQFTREQAGRLFGFVAVGGTVGAIAGSSVPAALAKGVNVGGVSLKLEPWALMVASCVALEVSARLVTALIARAERARAVALGPGEVAPPPGPADPAREPGAGVWDGLTLLGRSRYLQLIAVYMLLYATTSTFFYMERLRLVAAAQSGTAARTGAFAQIDLWQNTATLFAQVFLTSRVIRSLGIGGTLTIVPVASLLGFVGLSLWPTVAAITVIEAGRRALHFAFDRPAREALFTVVSPDERYKSKSLIDTFVYRAGDQVGGWGHRGLAALAVQSAYVAMPLSALWIVVGLWLGALQRRKSGPAVLPGATI